MKLSEQGLVFIQSLEGSQLKGKHLQAHTSSVRSLMKGSNINQNQFDALVSFAYSVGIKAFKRSDVYHWAMRGRHVDAAEGFMSWDNVSGGEDEVILPGLVRRRRMEALLYAEKCPPKKGVLSALRSMLRRVRCSLTV